MQVVRVLRPGTGECSMLAIIYLSETSDSISQTSQCEMCCNWKSVLVRLCEEDIENHVAFLIRVLKSR